jgi:hypothetical protein
MGLLKLSLSGCLGITAVRAGYVAAVLSQVRIWLSTTITRKRRLTASVPPSGDYYASYVTGDSWEDDAENTLSCSHGRLST